MILLDNLAIKRIGKDGLGVPIWEAVYRRKHGEKQIRRRFHAATRAEVERAVLLDSGRSGASIRWSEGVRLYLDAKLAEGRNHEAMGHVDRAARVFIELMGDMEVEETTAAVMKDFMQKVVAYPVIHQKTGRELRKSGPKVANHHRKELLTVARYLRAHIDKLATIPFEHVPLLPVKREKRIPVPKDLVHAYLDAVNPEVRRPLLLVLYYGLRSTAICNITPADVGGGVMRALDKMDVERRIPIDAMLQEIIEAAIAHRESFPCPADRLFVNQAGLAWNRMSLLRAAQRSWERAGLERKKIHEFRHTLGTLASKKFNPRMVQAAMGHTSEKSAAVYFHPDEEMAAEVREKIITELSQNSSKAIENGSEPCDVMVVKNRVFVCPCCGAKLIHSNKKGRKSK